MNSDGPSDASPPRGSSDDGWSVPSGRRLVGVIVVLVVALLALGFVAGIFGAPSVQAVENRFGGVNETTTEIETNVTVSNPNPVGASFGGVTVNYTVTMNEIAMAHGTKAGVGLEAGNTTIPFTTLMQNERIPGWWVSHIRNGERTTVRVHADVRSSTLGRAVSVTPVTREVDTDLLSSFATDEPQPITTDAPVGNPVLVLEETTAAWGTVSQAETPVEMTLTVRNPNQYPVVISRIGYDARMNSITVGEGATESGVTIPPGETRTVDARAVIANQNLDEWWVSHIERNQVSSLRIQFYVTLDLSAVGGGEVRVPLRPMTTTIETDIFGTKPAESSASGTQGGTETATSGDDTRTSSTPTPTTTDGGRVLETPTPTPTPGSSSPTPTPSPTPTDSPDSPETTDTQTGTETSDGLLP